MSPVSFNASPSNSMASIDILVYLNISWISRRLVVGDTCKLYERSNSLHLFFCSYLKDDLFCRVVNNMYLQSRPARCKRLDTALLVYYSVFDKSCFVSGVGKDRYKHHVSTLFVIEVSTLSVTLSIAAPKFINLRLFPVYYSHQCLWDR